MFNNLLQDVIEEFAHAINEDVDFFDPNKMKQCIDGCSQKFQKEKLDRIEKKEEKRRKIESEIMNENKKIQSLKEKFKKQ